MFSNESIKTHTHTHTYIYTPTDIDMGIRIHGQKSVELPVNLEPHCHTQKKSIKHTITHTERRKITVSEI